MVVAHGQGTRTGSLREDGCLELYESEAEWRASLPGWAERERFGIDFRHVRGSELANLQPGLSGRFVAGPSFRAGRPSPIPSARQGDLGGRRSRGATFLHGEVTTVGLDGGTPRLRLPTVARSPPPTLVIAAGAWSHRLARHFGDRIPLETERGYNTTLPAGAFDAETPARLLPARFRRHAARRPAFASAARWNSPASNARPTMPAPRRCWRRRTLPAGPEDRRRARMDGLSPLAARHAAGDRPIAASPQRDLCLRPRPSGPDPVGGDGTSDRRSGRRRITRPSTSRPTGPTASEDFPCATASSASTATPAAIRCASSRAAAPGSMAPP
jgi:hypothetical protein